MSQRILKCGLNCSVLCLLRIVTDANFNFSYLGGQSAGYSNNYQFLRDCSTTKSWDEWSFVSIGDKSSRRNQRTARGSNFHYELGAFVEWDLSLWPFSVKDRISSASLWLKEIYKPALWTYHFKNTNLSSKQKQCAW